MHQSSTSLTDKHSPEFINICLHGFSKTIDRLYKRFSKTHFTTALSINCTLRDPNILGQFSDFSKIQ